MNVWTLVFAGLLHCGFDAEVPEDCVCYPSPVVPAVYHPENNQPKTVKL